MKDVPLKDLKQHLAEIAQQVAQGNTIRVTRYNQPYFLMTPIQDNSLHVPKGTGETEISPGVSRPIEADILQMLAQDRQDRF